MLVELLTTTTHQVGTLIEDEIWLQKGQTLHVDDVVRRKKWKKKMRPPIKMRS